MKKRVISSLIMFAIIIPILILGGVPYSLMVGIVSLIAYKEMLDLKNTNKGYPNIVKLFGLLSMLYLIYSNYEKYGLLFGVSYKVLCGIILLICLPIIFFKEKYKIGDAFQMLATILFLGLGFNLLISIYNYGIKYFILLILITILTDTFALFGGKLIGKHNFTSISPNKTIEGCVIGSLVSTFVCTVYYLNVININVSILQISSIILFLSIIGQCGDLFFSAIKREYEIKDFSNLIPGHGGILDRLDSIIFVMYAFVVIFNYL